MKKTYLYLIVLVACTAEPDSSGNLFDITSSEPVVVGSGTISTSEFHESISYLDEDNKALFFTRSDRQFERSTIHVSYFREGKWQEASKLPFSNSGYDAGLSFTPDRDIAFFTSKRDPNVEGLSEEWNIWKTTLDENGNWSEPEALGSSVNSSGYECCLTMNSKGQTFFSSNRDGSWDIYEAQFRNGKFQDIELVQGTLNSEEDEWPAAVNGAGDLMLLNSIRKSGRGGDDIYTSRKFEGYWSEPKLLDSPINTSSFEDSPLLTGNGKMLLFSSWRDTETSKGVSNIYVIAFKEIE